jgi:general secretion pathway protein A
MSRSGEGRTTAIVIDEAQNLSNETFEELRLLSNFESYTRKLVQIVLVGQPELQERLRQPQLRQLRERVSVRAFINPLSRQEMERYIEHRLRQSGGSVHELFTPRALKLIVKRTGGIPRRANILCHNALLFAYGRSLPCVTARMATEAIAEMDERRPGPLRRATVRRVARTGRVQRWVAAVMAVSALALVASRLWMSAVSSTVAAVAPVPVSPALGESEAIGSPAAAPREPAALPEEDVLDGEAGRRLEAAPVVVEGLVPAASGEEEPPAPEERPVPQQDVRPVSSAPVPPPAVLWRIVHEAYGDQFALFDRNALFAEVQRLNPQVKDVNVIMAGDSLLLPLHPTQSADKIAGRVQ